MLLSNFSVVPLLPYTLSYHAALFSTHTGLHLCLCERVNEWNACACVLHEWRTWMRGGKEIVSENEWECKCEWKQANEWVSGALSMAASKGLPSNKLQKILFSTRLRTFFHFTSSVLLHRHTQVIYTHIYYTIIEIFGQTIVALTMPCYIFSMEIKLSFSSIIVGTFPIESFKL